MKKYLILLIVGISAALVPSCKKYEDGPRLSFKSKKSRVANEWKYEQVTSSNGANLTSSYANNFVEFKKDGSYIMTYSYGSATGTWQFASDKEDIVLTESGSGDSETLHILRLKEKELWFTISDSYGTMQYHLVPR